MKKSFLVLLFSAGVFFIGCGGTSDKTDESVNPEIELEWEYVYKPYHHQENVNYYNAIEYCKNLNYNDKSDWRLPKLAEMVHAFQNVNPVISHIDKNFWSITEKDDQHAYIISSNSNDPLLGGHTSKDKNINYEMNAFCVREKKDSEPVVNKPPVANAGSDININKDTPVYLDASSSYDGDGNIISYEWRKDGVYLAEGKIYHKPPFSVGTHTIGCNLKNTKKDKSSNHLITLHNSVPSLIPSRLC